MNKIICLGYLNLFLIPIKKEEVGFLVCVFFGGGGGGLYDLCIFFFIVALLGAKIDMINLKIFFAKTKNNKF